MGKQRRDSSIGERGAGVLTVDDVRALMDMLDAFMATEPGRPNVAFTGEFLNQLQKLYLEHLIKLMLESPNLTEALRARDAGRRARIFRQRLELNHRRMGPQFPLVLPYDDVLDESDAHYAKSLISGKGMEI